MEGVYVFDFIDIQKSQIFKGIEKWVKKGKAPGKKVSPQTLNALVMCTSPSYCTSSSGSSFRMFRHVSGNTYIFPTHIHSYTSQQTKFFYSIQENI